MACLSIQFLQYFSGLYENWRCKVVLYHNFHLPTELLLLNFQYALEQSTTCNLRASSLEQNDVHLQQSVCPFGVCKVNTDGNKINVFGLIGVGDWLRDSFINQIKGFTVNLGDGFIIEYELLGIFHGINLAWDTGFRMMDVECDSSSAVALLNNPLVSTHHLFSIINCFILKIREDWNCSVKHVFCEQNYAANTLATKNFEFSCSPHVF